MYKPVPPEMSVEEIADYNPIAYQIVMVILTEAAKNVYRYDPSQGLEKCLEELIDMLDRGYIKILFDDESEMTCIGVFNPLTGQYNTRDVAGYNRR